MMAHTCVTRPWVVSAAETWILLLVVFSALVAAEMMAVFAVPHAAVSVKAVKTEIKIFNWMDHFS